MKAKFLRILFMLSLFFIFIEAGIIKAAQFVITEVGSSSNSDDWIEVYCIDDGNGGLGYNVSGWKLREDNDGVNHTVYTDGTNGSTNNPTVYTGEYFIIADKAAAFKAAYPFYTGKVYDSTFTIDEGDIYWYYDGSALTNGGDSIEINFTISKSMEKIDEVRFHTDASYWAQSYLPDGTPGLRNSRYETTTNLYIDPQLLTISPPSSFTAPVDVQIIAKVYNTGSDLASNVKVGFYFDNNLIETRTISSIAPYGGYSEVSSELTINEVVDSAIKVVVQPLSGEGYTSDNEVQKYINVGTAKTGIIINEIMYNPSTEQVASTTDNQWFEIYNRGSSSVNLQNWTFIIGTSSSAYSGKIQDNITLNPGEYLVISDELVDSTDADKDSFESLYGDGSGVWGDGMTIWGIPESNIKVYGCYYDKNGVKRDPYAYYSMSTTQGYIMLIDNNVHYITKVIYFDDWGGDGDGSSLEKIDPTVDDVGAPLIDSLNWGPSQPAAAYGTPGLENSLVAKTHDIYVDRDSILFDPKYPATGDSVVTVYTRVYNAGTSDESQITVEFKVDGTTVDSVVIDNLPSGQSRQVAVDITPGTPTVGDSVLITVSASLLVTESDTRYNSASKPLLVGGVQRNIIISEVMYNPSPEQVADNDDGEWIELYNRGNVPVSIGGWELEVGSTSNIVTLPDIVMQPGDFLVVATELTDRWYDLDEDCFATLYGNKDGVWEDAIDGFKAIDGDNWSTLSNSADYITLRDTTGLYELTLNYLDDWGGDGDGSSIEIIDTRVDITGNSTIDERNWTASYPPEAYGTPGAINSTVHLTHDLYLTASDISFSPAFPTNLETVTIKANIRNAGSDTETNVTVYFYNGDPARGGDTLGVDTVSAVPYHSSATASIDTGPFATGNYNIFVKIVFPQDQKTLNNKAVNTLNVNSDDRNVVINEIMYNPSKKQYEEQLTFSDEQSIYTEYFSGSYSSTTKAEWVELYNKGDTDIDVSNWILNCNGKITQIPPRTVIAAKGYLVIARDLSIFDQLYGDGSGVWGDTTSENFSVIDGADWSLSNSAGYVELKNSNGTYKTRINYLNSWGGNGNGASLEKINPDVLDQGTYSQDGLNWTGSVPPEAYGTPGRQNSAVPQPYDLYITKNDIEIIPQFPSAGQEFTIKVLVHNKGYSTANNVDVYFYVDGANITQKGISAISPGGSAYSSTTTSVSTNGTHKISVAVSTTGEADTSLNQAEIKLLVGSSDTNIIINEVMYNPPEGVIDDDNGEWVELYNRGKTAVDISGWILDCGDPNHKTTISQNTIIQPGGYLVIARQLTDDNDVDDQSFATMYGNKDGLWIPEEDGFIAIDGADWSPLSNSSDYIKLSNSDGSYSVTLNYLDDWGGDGDGSSLEKTDSATDITGNLEVDAANWSYSVPKLLFGTPGRENSRYPHKYDLYVDVSEITLNPMYPNIGDTVKIGAIIHNGGVQDATNVQVGFYADNNLIETVTIPSVPGGFGIKTSAQTSFASSGSHTLNIRVGVVSGESDTSNNSVSTSILVNSDYPNIIITEVMYNPSTDQVLSNDDGEWVEIYNRGNTAVDISNWILNCGVDISLYKDLTYNDLSSFKVTFIPDSTVLQPGEFLVIARQLEDDDDDDTASFATLYGNKDGIWNASIDGFKAIDGYDWPSLSNSADFVQLISADLQYQITLNYVDDWGGDGDGSSLEKKDTATDITGQLSIDKDNWTSSFPAKSYGTPGKPNSNWKYRKDVYLSSSDVIFSSESINAGETVNIKVYVTNSGLESITDVIRVNFYVNGIYNSNAELSSLSVGSRDYVSFNWNPSSAGQYALTFSIDQANSPGLSNENDTSDNSVSVDAIVGDLSHNIVLSEIMYYAPTYGGNVDWVELYNRSSNPISVSGWRISGGSSEIVIPDNSEVPGHGFLVLTGDIYNFDMIYGDGSGVWGDAAGETYTVVDLGRNFISGSSEMHITLKNPSLSYNKTLYFSRSWGAYENGTTLEKVDYSIDDSGNILTDELNWSQSHPIYAYGTPGETNSVYPKLYDLYLGPKDIELSPLYPTLSDTITLSVTVHNGGTQDVSNVEVDLYDTIGGTLIGTNTINIVPYMGSRITKFYVPAVTLGAGYHELYVKVPAVSGEDDLRYNATTKPVLINSEYTNVIINEVMYNPSMDQVPDNEDGEWIELYNKGDTDIDISNWVLEVGSKSKVTTIPYGTIIHAGEYLVVARQLEDDDDIDNDAFATLYGNRDGVWNAAVDGFVAIDGNDWSLLSNTADYITLKSADGDYSLTLNYIDDWGGDGNGASLEKKDTETPITGDPDVDALNWGECDPPSLYGTPGHLNSIIKQDYNIYVTQADIIFSPAYPRPGDTVSITVLFHNNGRKTIPSAHAQVQIDTYGLLGQPSILNLPANGSASDSFVIPNIAAGNYNVYVNVAIDAITETNTYDNTAQKTLIVSSYATGVIINEIMYNPPLNSDAEWIELYNAGDSAVNITGWYIQTASKSIRISGVPAIQPKSYVVLVKDLEAFDEVYGNGSGIWGDSERENFRVYGDFGFNLSNTEDKVTLRNPEGTYKDIVNYLDDWGGDGNGSSLEKIDTSVFDRGDATYDYANWAPSVPPSAYGTPGYLNSVVPRDYNLYLGTEDIVLYPQYPSAGETVTITAQIHNNGDSDVSDVTVYFYLDNTLLGTGTISKVPSKGSRYINFTLPGQAQDTYTLKVMALTSLPESDLTYNTATKTLLVGNAYANIIINEVMYNPSTAQVADNGSGEWIELYNKGTTAVDISGWRLYAGSTSNVTTIPAGTILGAGEYLVIARELEDGDDEDAVGFADLYGNLDGIWNEEQDGFKAIDGADWSPLSNSADYITLESADKSYSITLNYLDDWGADGDGSSLEKKDTTTPITGNPTQDADNWAPSIPANMYGTPGYENSRIQQDYDLYITSDDISVTPTFPSPNSPISITVTVHNAGLNPVSTVGATFYLLSTSGIANPIGYDTITGVTVYPQNTVELSLNNYNVPNRSPLTFMVKVSQLDTETITQNNKAYKKIIVGAADPNIILNEFMYNYPNNTSLEWVELYNKSATNAVSINGWKLDCNGKVTVFRNITSMPPLSYLVITKDIGAFDEVYGNGTGVWGDGDNEDFTVIEGERFSLPNSEGYISLSNVDGSYVDKITYKDAWGADGTGSSLEKIDTTVQDQNDYLVDANNWGPSLPMSVGGTPGEENSIVPRAVDIYLDKAYLTFNPKYPDLNETTTISVIVFNNGESIAQNVAVNFYADAIAPSNLIDSVAITSIPSKGGKLLEISYVPSVSGTHRIYVDVPAVGLETDTRFNQVYKDMLVASDSANIIINEVMYNPSPFQFKDNAQGEWIELYNKGSNAVDISGWKLYAGSLSRVTIFPEGTIIGAGEYLVVARELEDRDNDGEAFAYWYGNRDGVWTESVDGFAAIDGEDWSALSNSSDYVRLVSADDAYDITLNYLDDWGGDGDGASLEKADTNTPITGDVNLDYANWTSSKYPSNYGTPGHVNSTIVLAKDLAVSRDGVLVSPANPDVNSYFKVTVYVYNDGSQDANNFYVGLYEGDPDFGGTLLKSTYVTNTVVPDSSTEIEFSNISFSTQGTKTLFVKVWGLSGETDNFDNKIFKKVIIGAPDKNIVINEVMYNYPDNSDLEWIELYNRGAAAININGWKLYIGSTILDISYSSDIEPGEYVVIAKDLNAFDEVYGNGTGFWGDSEDESGALIVPGKFSLSNSEGTIILTNEDGTYTTKFSYLDDWGADGDGATLEKIDANRDDVGDIYSDESNWAASHPTDAHGTPFEENSVVPIDTDVYVSADQMSLEPKYIDINESTSLVFRIYNGGLKDLSNVVYYILDGDPASGGDTIYTDTVTSIPSGTNYYARVNIPDSGLYGSDGFGSEGTHYVYLYVPAVGGETDVRFNKAYKKLYVGLNYSDIIINEVMYNPSIEQSPENADAEWIELYNKGQSAIDISGWKLYAGSTSNVTEIPSGTILAAGSYLVIARELEDEDGNGVSFSTLYGNKDGIWNSAVDGFDAIDGADWSPLSNSSDYVKLVTPDESYELVFYYDAREMGADGDGSSLEKIDTTTHITGNINIDKLNWAPSRYPAQYGTPGQVNSVIDVAKDIGVIGGEIEFSKLNPSIGETIVVTTRIRNFGTSSVSNVEAGLYVGDPDYGGTFIDSTIISELYGKVSEKVRFNLYISNTLFSAGGIKSIYIKVNPLPGEANLINNKALKKISVESEDNNILLSEIMYRNPNSSYLDWLEIYNKGNEDRVLNGWTILVGSRIITLDSTAIVPANGYLVICRKKEAYDAVYGNGSGEWGDAASENYRVIESTRLSISPGQIVLYNPSKTYSDKLVFDASYGGNNTGASIERISYSVVNTGNLYSDILNWSASRPASANGTPGAENSVAGRDYDVYIDKAEINYVPKFVSSGDDLTFDVPVHNNGTKAASNVVVYLYNGDPDIGGTVIDSVAINYIKPGVLSHAALVWNSVPAVTSLDAYIKVSVSGETDLRYNEVHLGIPIDNEYANVVINEIMYHPSPAQVLNEASGEWIELYNKGTTNIDISNWVIYPGTTSESRKITLPYGTIIPAGGYIVVASELEDGDDADTESFATLYGNKDGVWEEKVDGFKAIQANNWSNLSNTSDFIKIVSSDGSYSSVLYYLDDWGGDGDGSSLERIDTAVDIYGNPDQDQLYWKPSIPSDRYGTPGRINSRVQLPYDLYIGPSDLKVEMENGSEIITSSGNAVINVKVHNSGKYSVSSGTVYLYVDEQDTPYYTFNIGSGGTLSAGSYREFSTTWDTRTSGAHTITAVIAGVENEWDTSDNSVVKEIYVDNPASSVILTEIMHDHSQTFGSRGDWFELYNMSSQPVDLSNWIVTINDKQIYTIPAGTILNGHSYIVFGENEEIFDELYGNNSGVWGDAADEDIDYKVLGSLSLDASATLNIRNPSKTYEINFKYDRAFGAYRTGSSIEKVDYSVRDTGDPSIDIKNWKASVPPSAYGTPGETNSVVPKDYDVYLGGDDVKWQPKYPTTKDTISIDVTVSNGGEKDVKNVQVAFTIGGSDTFTQTIESIPSYQKRSVTFSLSPISAAGAYSYSVVLSLPSVTEDDLRYNEASGVIYIDTPAANIIINEVMYNPSIFQVPDNSDGEWIELYNKGDSDIDLSGWKLYTGTSLRYYNGVYTASYEAIIPQGTIIPAHGYVVIASELEDGPDYDEDCFANLYGNRDGVWNPAVDGFIAVQGNMSLSNTKGYIILNSPSDDYNLVFNYVDNWGGDGDGSSLEKKDTETVITGNPDIDASNWTASKPADLYGTPGRENSVIPKAHNVYLTSNDIVLSPAYPSVGETFYVSVVVHNNGQNDEDVTVDLYRDGNLIGSKSISVEQGKYADAVFADNVSSTGVVEYKAQASIAGNESDLVDNTASLRTDIGSADKDLVISEIMYAHPYSVESELLSSGYADWFEIYNGSDTDIDVSFWDILYSSLPGEWSGATITSTGEQIEVGVVAQNSVKLGKVQPIKPGEYVVITNNITVYEILYGDGSGVWGDNEEENYTVVEPISRFSLYNSGGIISIKNPEGTYMDRVVYDKSWGAYKTGSSLEKINLLKRNTGNIQTDGINWGPSIPPSAWGTPGRPNSISSKAINITIGPENVSITPKYPSAKDSFTINVEVLNTGDSVVSNVKAKFYLKTVTYETQSITLSLAGKQLNVLTTTEIADSQYLGEISLGDIPRYNSRRGSFETGPLAQGNYEIIVEVSTTDSESYSYDNRAIKKLLVDNPASNVIINEVMYHPSIEQVPDEGSGEWIELYNRSATQSVDISGWKLYAGSTSKVTIIPYGTILGPGEYLVVARQLEDDNSDLDQEAFSTLYGNKDGVWDPAIDGFNAIDGADWSKLSNTADYVELKNADGSYDLVLNYLDDWGGDGDGASLEKKDTATDITGDPGVDGANWGPCNPVSLYGTPGYENSLIPKEHDLRITDEDIIFDPPYPNAGEPFGITVVVHNDGSYTEGPITVTISDEKGTDYKLISSIARGSYSSVSFSSITRDTGVYNLKVYITPADSEQYTYNNTVFMKYAVGSIDDNVIINEVMYNPFGEANNQWVELYNMGDTDVDLGGWILDFSGKVKILPANVGVLESKSYLVIAKDEEAFDNIYGDGSGKWGDADGELINVKFFDDFKFSLSKTEDYIQLWNKDRTYHTKLHYLDDWGADGDGSSLEKRKPTILDTGDPNTDGTNWGPSVPRTAYGTPGKANSLLTKAYDAYVSSAEILFDPTYPDAGGSVTIQVTVHNNGTKDLNADTINFYYNNVDTANLIGTQYETIPAGQSRIVSILWSPIPTTAGAYDVIVDVVGYDGEVDTNYNRASKKLLISSKETNIIITEVMYNPAFSQVEDDDDGEWVELYNRGTESVDLSNWKLSCGDDNHITVIPTGTILNPGEFLVVARELIDGPDADEDAFATLYGNRDGYWNEYEDGFRAIDGNDWTDLSNTADFIRLENADGSYQITLNYLDDWGADGTGSSLEKKDTETNITGNTDIDVENWTASVPTSMYGTPGTLNSVWPQAHDVYVAPEDISFSPEYPAITDQVTIYAVIHNNGEYDETNVVVKFEYKSPSLATGIIGYETAAIIPKKKTAEVSINIPNSVITENGNYEIAVTVLPVSDEVDTRDNTTIKILTVGSEDANVVINEVMYNPSSKTDKNAEWIELYNKHDTASIRLDNWKLDISGRTITIPFNTTIGAGDYVVIAKSLQAFDNVYGNGSGLWGDSTPENFKVIVPSTTFSLSNTSGNITLKNVDGTYSTTFSYIDDMGADGNGSSLEKVDPSILDKGEPDEDAKNWKESVPSSAYGTPGAENSVKPRDYDVYISKDDVNFTPQFPRVGEEFYVSVRVHNNGTKDATNVTVYCTVVYGAIAPVVKTYRIDRIPVDGTRVANMKFTATGPGVYTVSVKALMLNEDDLRFNEATRRLFIGTDETKIVISEIMYHPSPTQVGYEGSGEWIELYNKSDTDIDLSGWHLEVGSPNHVTTFPSGTKIKAHNFIVVARELEDGDDEDKLAFANLYGNKDGVWNVADDGFVAIDGEDWALLSNSSDYITLSNPDDDYRLTVTYLDDWGGDGDGNSLELVNPDADFNELAAGAPAYTLRGDFVPSFASSIFSAPSSTTGAGGTPGEPNSSWPADTDVLTNAAYVYFDPEYPTLGEDVKVTVYVFNKSDTYDANNVVVQLYQNEVGDTLVGEDTIDILPKQGAIAVEFNIDSSILSGTGVYTFVAYIVPLNEEIDTVNNKAYKTLLVNVPQSNVVINEIMYNYPNESKGDWVELYNKGNQDISLDGWYIYLDGSLKQFPAGTTIPASGFLVVVANEAVFDGIYGNGSGFWNDTDSETSTIVDLGSFSLSNSAGQITLADSQYVYQVTIKYTDDWGADGDGRSLEKISPEIIDKGDLTEDAPNWKPSTKPKGTPGDTNTRYTPLGTEAVQVGLSGPDKYLVSAPYYVEIQAQDTNGYRVRRVAATIEVTSDGYVEFSTNDGLSWAKSAKVDLTDGAVEIMLRSLEEGSRTVYLEDISKSFDTGGRREVALKVVATLDVVINEIMYDPRNGDNEWVELYNKGDTIDISGWTFGIQRSGNLYYEILLPEGTEIPKNGYIVLAEDLLLFEQRWGDASGVWGDASFETYPVFDISTVRSSISLGTKETVKIEDAQGNIIDLVSYTSKWGGKNDRSLERINPNARSSDQSNWSSCIYFANATPGAQNSVYGAGADSYKKGKLSLVRRVISPKTGKFATIKYSAPKDALITLKIFDLKGRLVKTLIDYELRGGDQEVVWDGRDENLEFVPVGIYLIMLETYNQVQVTKDIIPIVVGKPLK